MLLERHLPNRAIRVPKWELGRIFGNFLYGKRKREFMVASAKWIFLVDVSG